MIDSIQTLTYTDVVIEVVANWEVNPLILRDH